MEKGIINGLQYLYILSVVELLLRGGLSKDAENAVM